MPLEDPQLKNVKSFYHVVLMKAVNLIVKAKASEKMALIRLNYSLLEARAGEEFQWMGIVRPSIRVWCEDQAGEGFLM
nr:probable magnesium transporter NIPA8 [Ipomoea batatas]